MLDYRTTAGAFAMFLLLGTAAGAQPSSGQQNLPSAAQQPAGCAPVQALVCAVLAGEKQSYWNECQARRAGALVLSAGECRNKPSYGY
jgi:hypothetical protein